MPVRLILSLLALVLTLSSCIEGDEELWLNRDGSGRIEVTYRMPPAIMNRFGGAAKLASRLKEAIEKEPSIHVQKLSHHVNGAQVVFELQADFDDAITFLELPKNHLRESSSPDSLDKPSAEEAFFGKIDLNLSGLSLDFKRNIDLSPILPTSIRDNAAMLGESAFNYTLHLPAKPSSHNASSISEGGKTLHWTFPLRDHASSPMLLETKMFLPLPWWAWTLLALLILLLGLATCKLLKRLFRPSR